MNDTKATVERAYLSKHAAIRSQQRAIRGALIAYVLENADIETNVGGGCFALQISGVLNEPSRHSARARHVRVIENPRGKIVTVMWNRRGSRLRPAGKDKFLACRWLEEPVRELLAGDRQDNESLAKGF
jgi:hypothetical protein